MVFIPTTFLLSLPFFDLMHFTVNSHSMKDTSYMFTVQVFGFMK